jgi:hypothetical protein
LILLAFFLPLAMYVLILGTINRRRHPLMVYGPWDFAGILFAASGFLLFGGPGVISVLNESWRDALIFGPNSSSSATAAGSLWLFGYFLLAVYFVVVVAGAGYFLWRARIQTSIYNVDLETVQLALDRIYQRLGLRPMRSGDMYYFGMTGSGRTDDQSTKHGEGPQGIQTTAPAATTVRMQTPLGIPNVILEIEAFRSMCHVTLRWNPVHSVLRQAIERELDRELSETSSNNSLGAWLTLGSCALFLLTFLLGVGVLFYRVLNRY